MAIRIKARPGETAEQMLRRFKKLCEKEGLTKEVKRRAYYEKPSERKQRAMRKTQKRIEIAKMGGLPPQLTRGNSRGGPGGPGGGGSGGGGGGTGPGRSGGGGGGGRRY